MRPSPALRRFAAGHRRRAPSCSQPAEATTTPRATARPDSTEAAADDTTAGSTPSADTCGDTIEDGVLTIAHGRAGLLLRGSSTTPPSPAKASRQRVAYAVAAEMGYDQDAVVWVRTTFDEAIQPGAKNFDINLQQYSITDERKENIDFSLPYYTSNQAIVGPRRLGGRGSDDRRRPQGRQVRRPGRHHQPGLHQRSDPARLRTSSCTTTTSAPRPPSRRTRSTPLCSTCRPRCTSRASRSRAAASSVSSRPMPVDRPISSASCSRRTTRSTACVDQAITTLTENGELDAITQEWLSDYHRRPVITVE